MQKVQRVKSNGKTESTSNQVPRRQAEQRKGAVNCFTYKYNAVAVGDANDKQHATCSNQRCQSAIDQNIAKG